jgi:hypothetical protein
VQQGRMEDLQVQVGNDEVVAMGDSVAARANRHV